MHINFKASHCSCVSIVQDVNEFQIVPEVEMALLAASYEIAVELLDADVSSARLSVEIMIHQSISPHLPITQMQIAAGYELLAAFEADGCEVSHCTQASEGQSHASNGAFVPPIDDRNNGFVFIVNSIVYGIVFS
jgi:hypothetical protein